MTDDVKYKIQMVCVDCGCTFEAIGRQAKRCEKCKKELQREHNREYSKKAYAKAKIPPSVKPKLSIYEITRLNALYNKINKANLGYGYFVAMVHSGAIDIKELKRSDTE